MSSGGRWKVVVRNDDHNTFAIVYRALRSHYAMTEDQARFVTEDVHLTGTGAAALHTDRAEAEAAVVALQRQGLNAKLEAE
ncbi:ATP-dependent Clp protease adaptor ClpS [Lentzea alba]|uniref:ATP-dependent Clp protease adaptor ClpS n=1 Tax=Lentzea alba TaxID=2714351 RepID=UPI0039BFE108